MVSGGFGLASAFRIGARSSGTGAGSRCWCATHPLAASCSLDVNVHSRVLSLGTVARVPVGAYDKRGIRVVAALGGVPVRQTSGCGRLFPVPNRS